MLGVRSRSYDRSRLLAQAARARRRGRAGKAITCYRKVLSVEPDNADVLRRLAPLLARAGRGDEAWPLYRHAAEEFARRGFLERAIGVYREAAVHLPREVELWLALARLELERDRRVDAARLLREGRGHFRSRRQRAEAMQLLHEAHRLEPADLPTTFDLASLRARCGQRSEAVALLDGLLGQLPHRRLRIRTRQLLVAPGAATARQWLRAVVGRR